MPKLKVGSLVKVKNDSYLSYFLGESKVEGKIFVISKIIEYPIYIYDEEEEILTNEIDYIEYYYYIQRGKKISRRKREYEVNFDNLQYYETRTKKQQLEDKIKELWERQPFVKEKVNAQV